MSHTPRILKLKLVEVAVAVAYRELPVVKSEVLKNSAIC
ncbi:hypothetical protein PF010_g8005 [Phytophthora fragariae]|nr:hypothetical protein PF003_g36845 [Phytophthora fragariae]KAE8940604.1 hypothetical protein PF009_g9576 [Phytophthora fragariae]KAE9099753.1 hypothetical protein PF006_g23064 [Phytophthora fragariae]KAE9112449.1 hypothetical protein PF007_g11087 [Phytophthora fragariae]KAE9119050.1 hypothetical protein PF010_g8005 [Phytophthora fragariae]